MIRPHRLENSLKRRSAEMADVSTMLHDLVVANRILAHEGVVDGYGHVSMRHPHRPDRFFLARSRSAELVELDDLMEYDLDCNPIDQRGRIMYVERPIHGAVYQARPEVRCVVHNHAYEVIPFTITKTPLRPTAAFTGCIGLHVPVWDIRKNFGDTNMMVTTMAQGHDLAKTLAGNRAALLRGHGAVVTGRSLKEGVLASLYLMVNAKIQSEAMRFGEITFLSEGETAMAAAVQADSLGTDRVWEYLARRSGFPL
jgi:ribulose-5-phosphate 4-epimerase/fuculose-1-phosphate aldolase